MKVENVTALVVEASTVALSAVPTRRSSWNLMVDQDNQGSL